MQAPVTGFAVFSLYLLWKTCPSVQVKVSHFGNFTGQNAHLAAAARGPLYGPVAVCFNSPVPPTWTS